jgi:leader peptidase (prepilin peptidase)/N-methyltransferase
LVTGGLFAATYQIVTSFFNSATSQVPIVDYVFVICIFTIISSLIAIFFIDLKHQIIPDSLTIVASFSAVIIHTITYFTIGSSTTPLNYVLSSLGASLFFAFLIVITKGKGMGWGDVKFAAFMGLLLGFRRVVFSLYFAFLTGACVSAILIFGKRKKFGQTIAFGPFLVLATIFAQFGLLDIVWHYIYGNLL